MNAKVRAERILQNVDVQLGSARPWDIQVHDARFYERVLSGGSLALGESYVDGWWDCDDIPELVSRLARIAEQPFTVRDLLLVVRYRFYNLQKRTETIARHYNLGNDLYETFLGPYMQYSSADFTGTGSLAVAQEQKLASICRLLELDKEKKVLDIGAGWGGFAQYAARTYGARVTGITVSEKQAHYARKVCADLPVEIIVQDYRNSTGVFDSVVMCEMLEHVGHKNYRTIMQKVHELLAPKGKVFVQVTTGENKQNRGFDPWLHSYIFPNGMIPKVSQLTDAFEGLFTYEETTHGGLSGERTLLAWEEDFTAHWENIAHLYDERFFRMWRYYLLFSAGTFRAGINTTTQFVLTKKSSQT